MTAFLLTLVAGLATSLGGLLALHPRVRTPHGLGVALAFAAGAMLVVAAVEILPASAASLRSSLGSWSQAWLVTTGSAGLAAASVVVAARRLGKAVGASEQSGRGRYHDAEATRRRVRRSGVLVALAVAAHNIPEGLVTFVTAVDDPRAGLLVAMAVALHNVPEGVAVAAPLYGTGIGGPRAFALATASGLAEPLGALIGYVVLSATLPPDVCGVVFASIAGVMVAVSCVELLPNADRLVSRGRAARAASCGAVVMGVSLLMLGTV
nr:ZIP family metal transporter [Nocardioides zeae]